MRPQQSETPAVVDSRQAIRDYYLAYEHVVVHEMIAGAQLSPSESKAISARAADLVRGVRKNAKPTIMEKFLAEYGLTTKEGVALMCLAEAMLRVPDATTVNDLIEDKITSGCWGDHRGKASSSLINTATIALLITSNLLKDSERKSVGETLRKLLKRLGEPVIRTVASQAMKEMGRQFVLGRDIKEAQKASEGYMKKGYTYSYDMLGEAARTDHDAQRYYNAYSDGIDSIAKHCSGDVRKNPGISVKLSALLARYEYGNKERVMKELVPRAMRLVKKAAAANMGFNIDAEEQDRLELSMDVIEALLSDPELAGWNGFGVCVQAYGKRAPFMLDWLYGIAKKYDRRIMVRLVKGAYWDAEIKRAQVMGLDGFPVFTRKACSDVSFLSCSTKLLNMTDRIYPQFATHNAHSVSAILELARVRGEANYEFQRLHGMGESLHGQVMGDSGVPCRIYAPVGPHHELLAYLVRRLLENGANSSFVNQIVDEDIPPEMIAKDPIDLVKEMGDDISSKAIVRPTKLFGENRRNSKGWDLTDSVTIEAIDKGRDAYKEHHWKGGPLISGKVSGTEAQVVRNPANPEDLVGHVTQANEADIETAISAAQKGFKSWSATPVEERAACLRKVADLYEENTLELFALATREAGKSLSDSVAEIREAVDFAHYYANEGVRYENSGEAIGPVVCISPWNFPLAIFTGQILANLVAGNVVLAKPAEQTSLLAVRAVELMHQAGIPKDAIQLVPGTGATVGAGLTSDSRIAGVCFTGSTNTAKVIDKAMAENMAPDAVLVAETGGLNAMIVDSTALPEQVVRDVLASSFQSAGQRCSALRMLYVQKDIADSLLKMLYGAMEELGIGDPWLLSTDVGPVIDEPSAKKIIDHCKKFENKDQLLKKLSVPHKGNFVSPAVIKVNGIGDLEEEIFGPVLHVATFDAKDIDKVVDDINAKGYGLTFGVHSRVDSRVDRISRRIKVGNIYVNRNQIGAVVGSQPFGGEGLSGTGPKAGGPQYVRRFMKGETVQRPAESGGKNVDARALESLIGKLGRMNTQVPKARVEAMQSVFDSVPEPLDAHEEVMPGPTGESNILTNHARGTVLCLGPDKDTAIEQMIMALAQGNKVVVVAPGVSDTVDRAAKAGLPVVGVEGQLEPDALETVKGFEAAVSCGEHAVLKPYRQALRKRDGALLPLITEHKLDQRYVIERHLCVDTTAAGGNASLIAASE
ncbi:MULTISPECIES: bifunctional proline dehydrogenase/L-glutamate gamma-semialdehyde dehydrogenase PutA [unclassified Marinobacter]|uniref:bifunctional proline dehydrogenase/L-glutamate gamma-semialdehyde dehydrogenase PutA n=1 Tax=unclassified Marinobacter TaxID=83889 RepID=UPI000BF2D373|nr:MULTISPECIES: bifunctional proline dehydrogenase/L-glutamate gamma-semialdehyde dehydrogenase PutA [unclassified Marinobacter]PFG09723.1 L-proline dehydrogenase /delta-1-pyrroline-5-carboxylate dehydrogenase [Marinobacter sp. LV10MA510-1]PFG51654.1 L-proline dehydrogenase /delta-1-pyrroline-5-carboxylate dehydrogenase [Marinobacter sp. LV10R520-4]